MQIWLRRKNLDADFFVTVLFSYRRQDFKATISTRVIISLRLYHSSVKVGVIIVHLVSFWNSQLSLVLVCELLLSRSKSLSLLSVGYTILLLAKLDSFD